MDMGLPFVVESMDSGKINKEKKGKRGKGRGREGR